MIVNIMITTFYILLGVMFLTASIESLRDKTNPVRYGTAAFWFIFAIIFALGQFIGNVAVGALIVILGVLLLFKQVRTGHIRPLNKKTAEKAANRLGAWVFFPSVILAVLSIVVTKIGNFTTGASTQIGVCVASIVSLIVAMLMTKAGPRAVYEDTQRMTREVGAPGIQPQLLAMLGLIFTSTGIGKIVAKSVAGVFPAGNHLLGVIVYCLAMVVFTMVMGDAFGAFAVITASIGVPFVIAQGGSPVVVASIGMLAGYCGTMMTPMAAAFNSMPVALLDIQDPMGVIKKQFIIALVILASQIATMYFLAF